MGCCGLGYGLNNPGFYCQHKQGFSLPQDVWTDSGSDPASCSVGTRVKQLEHEVDHLPLFNAEFKNE
jgi:hypothetical protein